MNSTPREPRAPRVQGDDSTFTVEWVREMRRTVEWCVGLGSRPDDALGCLIVAHVRFTLSEREIGWSARRVEALWGRRTALAVAAVKRHDPELVRYVGWRTTDGFHAWWHKVYRAWALSGPPINRAPEKRLAERVREIDQLQSAIESEAREIGLNNPARDLGRARDGLAKSEWYSDRTAEGREEIRDDASTALFLTITRYGCRALTIGPKGEGISERAVRDAHGRRRTRPRSVSLDAPKDPHDPDGATIAADVEAVGLIRRTRDLSELRAVVEEIQREREAMPTLPNAKAVRLVRANLAALMFGERTSAAVAEEGACSPASVSAALAAEIAALGQDPRCRRFKA